MTFPASEIELYAEKDINMKIGTFLLQIVKMREICGMASLNDALMHPAVQGISCLDGDTKVYDRLDLPETKRILDFHGLQTSSVYHTACCDDITETEGSGWRMICMCSWSAVPSWKRRY